MPYYNDNFDRRRGGYGRGGYNNYGRDNYSGRGYGGGRPNYDYDDRQGNGGYEPRQFRFDIGQKAIHTATGIEVSVVRYGREQLECRKPDLSTVWLYEYELEPVTSDVDNSNNR